MTLRSAWRIWCWQGELAHMFPKDGTQAPCGTPAVNVRRCLKPPPVHKRCGTCHERWQDLRP